MKKVVLLLSLCLISSILLAGPRKFKWATVNVPEEGGVTFQQITRDGSDLAHPAISFIGWFTGHMLSVSPDGSKIAYIDFKNTTRNIYLKSTNAISSAAQRTFRARVNSVCYSPNGKDIVFCENRGEEDGIYLISSEGGNVVRQIASGCNPSFSLDGRHIFFTREEVFSNKRVETIWSYDLQSGMLSNYSTGDNATPIPGDIHSFICERKSEYGFGEIWKVDTKTGMESMLLSTPGYNYTSPIVSPDGQWILLVANSSSNDKIRTLTQKPNSKKRFFFSNSKQNTDIYAMRIDGSELVQLTYHKGNDFSPVWAPDGKSFYFLSQRGSKTGEYNIWKVDFNVH